MSSKFTLTTKEAERKGDAPKQGISSELKQRLSGFWIREDSQPEALSQVEKRIFPELSH